MPVIVQIASASTGGIGRLTRDISSVLDSQKITNYICYGRGEIFNNKRDFMFGTKSEIIMHAVLTRIVDRTGFFSTKGTKELLDFLDEVHPDLIHLHNLHGYYLNIKLLFDYIKKKNITVVWTLHDCWAFTGHCVYFSMKKCEQWKEHCCNCEQLKEYPSCYFIGNVSRNYKDKKNIFNGVNNLTVVTPSKWLGKLVKESFLQNYQVKVIHNGINLNVFRIKTDPNINALKLSSDKKIILGVASTWVDRKGYNDFIRLSRLLPNTYVIVMVGLSKKQKREIPSRIIGIGHTENEEQLVDLYNSAELFLNLTYEDNYPTTNLEAMACGTSVLTYKTGGSPESITHSTGYIVPQGDLNRVVEIILHHHKNAETIKSCVQHAANFNKNKCFFNYVDLYTNILRNK